MAKPLRSVLPFTLLLIAGCTTTNAADDDGDGRAADSALASRADVAVVGDTPTFLKISESQAEALAAGEKCAVPAGAALALDGPARLTSRGHIALHLAPGTRLANCSLVPTAAPLYVYAPHIRTTESRSTAGSFREGMISTSDGLKIRYTACPRFGQPEPGTYVVLPHPAGADAETIWHRPGALSGTSVVATLVAQGLCPIAIDLRGHGESSKPTAPDAYDVVRMQTDVIETLDTLGVRRAHFHGYSLGGSLLIRMLPQLAQRKLAMSAAFGGAGLPDGRPDDVHAKDRRAAEQADQASKGQGGRTDAALAALYKKAPWTQPMPAIAFDKIEFPMLGMFGEFDSPMQNTRAFAKQAPRSFVGTAVFRDRLHIGTISPLTMPRSYAEVLADFFAGVVPPARGDYTLVPQRSVDQS